MQTTHNSSTNAMMKKAFLVYQIPLEKNSWYAYNFYYSTSHSCSLQFFVARLSPAQLALDDEERFCCL